MVAKPDYIDWTATNGEVAPVAGKKTTGWGAGEKVPFENLNWFFKITDEWTKYLEEQTSFNRYKAAEAISYSNLGVSKSSNQLVIHAADGSALSASNKATVRMPSASDSGKTVELEFTANVTINDSGHATPQILGLFGTTASKSWTTVNQFFLNVVNADDSSANAKFFISRTIGNKKTPSSSLLIGKSETAPSTSDQNSIIILDSGVTVSNYTSKPCIPIGVMSFTKTTNDAIGWNVALTSSSAGYGIGKFGDENQFQVPALQFGATDGASIPNGGTPAGGMGSPVYRLEKNGVCRVWARLIHTGLSDPPDGSGAVSARWALPFKPLNGSALAICGLMRATFNTAINMAAVSVGDNFFQLQIPSGTNGVLNPVNWASVVSTGAGTEIIGEFSYMIDLG